MVANFEEIFSNMLSAFQSNLTEGKGETLTFCQNIFAQSKANLERLSLLLADGTLSKNEFDSEIEDEKINMETQLLALQIIAKSTIQKAINSAFDVLTSAIIKII
jgi:hypothetical protein